MIKKTNTKKRSTKSKKINQLLPKVGKTAAVQSVFRTAKILKCLANNRGSIKDIAEECDLSMTTVHRILQSLEESELAFQDPIESKYYLGPLFTQLSVTQINLHRYLTSRSYEEINRLSSLFGESTTLDVEVGLQIITLLHVLGKFNYGMINPEKVMFYSSVSKAIMSQHSDDEIEIIMGQLKSPTRESVTDIEDIKKQIIETRHQGYIVYHEPTEGIMGVSVPIRNYICPAALSVVGPEIRLGQITPNIIEEMKISASRISNSILKT
jgi:DNA-binding IclR family transcriptional regulator